MDRKQILLERGFATIYLIGALVVGAALVGSYFFGRSDGEDLERSKWVNQQNADLREANQKIIALTADVARMEREHADRLAAASAQYQEGLRDAQLQADDLSERLRRYHSMRERSNTGSKTVHDLPRTATSTPRCDGPPAARLGRQYGEFLVAYAKRAQALAKQLIACQSIVRSDRQVR